MRKTFRKKNRRSRGQVLILAVLAIVILAVAILVLFDIQRIMREKIRVMSGVDAAALTGAQWQKHTLNLMGELNLVKACQVLISDSIYGIGGNPDDFMKVRLPENPSSEDVEAAIKKAREELEQLKKTADMLTEMQVRIGYVGPLIGFGAAQQAAKNNGLPANRNCNLYMIDYYNLICDDGIYGNPDIAPQVYHGYSWRKPYADMIFNLTGSLNPESAQGVAVGTSIRHLGMPALYCDPPTNPNFIAYLQLKVIMEAIAANDWCLLQPLIDADNSAYVGKWWGDIKIEPNRHFLGGAELLPIHSDYSTGEQIFDFADSAGYLDNVIRKKSGREDLLIPINQHYNRVDPVRENGSVNFADKDMKFNPLPSITWAIFGDRWQPYPYDEDGVVSIWKNYLRSGFRKGFDYYSGAISYFSVSVPNTTLTRRHDLPSGFRRSHDDKKTQAWRKMWLASEKASAAQERIITQGIRFNASAKPFGMLKAKDGSVHHPFAASMILPVFNQTALIPVALERPDGLEMEDRAWIIFLSKFLPALGTVDRLEDVQKVMDPEHYQVVNQAGYIVSLQKLMDPQWRAAGRMWLDAEATGHDVFDAAGNRIGHVTDTVNRDHCLDWKSGGSGYRTGPGELH